ncbi:type II toxin-antitoxin system HipA family toxin YjjJ [Ralstonia sp. UBA689]|uniref:type II toxin-antitoxin system HipA family toxin YjjJ n=1 Tax=Ralstonia sp. UBA689 TaxID=1947373 RepID=UPI0025F96F51|nr:type II toxin-antitoxin system HipA family toxin YjjJ [Ralstonia sp. UBA689]
MASHVDQIRLSLANGPVGARQLIEIIGISQPTLSRAITSMGNEVVRFGAARSIQYALLDTGRGLGDVPVYRVGEDGAIRPLGQLVPVRPEGFVMRETAGMARYSEGLPWWLADMRPQGFLGRAYAARYAPALGLPANVAEWTDTQALRALIQHGQDAVGNLLLGDMARERFLNTPLPTPISAGAKGEVYVRLAQEAASGDLPGSSAGGEHPKFMAFVETPDGPRHMLVKFSLPDANLVTERWRDLLLSEHHALETLAAAEVLAARSRVVDHGAQRFLEVERFDRVGALGRRGVFSLASVDAEFVGEGRAAWPVITARLASEGHITRESAGGAALLYAFGTLIGNTDMHNGNLSFTNGDAHHARPYVLAPAYDMLPMGFAPRSSGAMSDILPLASLHASVANTVWARALGLALDYLARMRADDRFSAGFRRCVDGLAAHIDDAGARVSRLG